MNIIVAESLRKYADILESEDDFDTAVDKLTREVFSNHKRIIFNGDNYTVKWATEAKERGEIYSSDKELTIRVHGKLMRFPQSQKQRIADSIAKDIVAVAEQAENEMEEEKYLRYLCRFKEKVERGDTRWLE